MKNKRYLDVDSLSLRDDLLKRYGGGGRDIRQIPMGYKRKMMKTPTRPMVRDEPDLPDVSEDTLYPWLMEPNKSIYMQYLMNQHFRNSRKKRPVV